MKATKSSRKIDICIISDVHLGTYGCKSHELLNYLDSIEPEILILNGDIIDGWQFSKRYFPRSHFHVLQKILSLITSGKTVYYITGNHDEFLRKFKGFSFGNLHLVNHLILDLDNKKHWIFHGDIFDYTMKHSKWVAKLGGKGYDLLILINTLLNWCSKKMGRGKISLSKRIKDSVKGVINHVESFEEIAAAHAIDQGYNTVICGHIHKPQMRTIETKNGEVNYLNSGDWVENLTALEYVNNTWHLTDFSKNQIERQSTDDDYLMSDSYNSLIQELFGTAITKMK